MGLPGYGGSPLLGEEDRRMGKNRGNEHRRRSKRTRRSRVAFHFGPCSDHMSNHGKGIMSTVGKLLRHNPLYAGLVFVPVVLYAEHARPESHTMLFILSVVA